MASVQELLLAANAKAPKSVFSSLNDLLDTGIQGYQTGQNIRDKNVEIATRLIQQQKLQQEIDQSKQEQAFQMQRRAQLAEQLGKQSNEVTKSALNDATVKPVVSMPEIKLARTTVDEKGHISDSYEPTAPKETPYTSEQNAAIISGDPNKAASVFPGGIPEKVTSQMIAARGTGQFAGVQNGQALIINGKQQTVSRVPLGDSGPILPTTANEQQAKASKFASQMAESSKSFDNLTRDGFDPTSTVSGLTSVLPNAIQPKGVQAYEQLKNNWLSANLRDESGAVIGNQEYIRDERRYFPQSGDSPERIAQKARARAVAEQAMAKEAGQFGVQKPQEPKSSGPVPGTIEEGHLFKGGDPADPKNWVKQ